MTINSTDWARVADAMAEECPSPALRSEAVDLLTVIEALGPLRPARDEFRRVYAALRWNEAARVRRVADLLRMRGRGKPAAIRAEAWAYTIAAHDEWITHARIYYLVTGILESALRARVHTRLTDHFGTPDWPNETMAVPSGLRNRLQKNELRAKQLTAVAEALERTDGAPLSAGKLDEIVAEVRTAMEVSAVEPFPPGDVFLRERTTLFDLLMWFEGRRFWNEPVRMKDLFRGRTGTDTVPQFDKLRSVLTRTYDARNDVAHYRPGPDLSLAEPFFAASTLCTWLGADLQHIYGAIDSRASTEMIELLRPLGDEVSHWDRRDDRDACAAVGCMVPHPPLEWLLDRAPLDRDDLLHVGVTRACLYHRVQHRDALHRPRRLAP